MKQLHIFSARLLLFWSAILWLAPHMSKAQVSDMLEVAFPGVVTIAIAGEQDLKRVFAGIKSGVPPEEAYRHLRAMNGKFRMGSGFVIEVDGEQFVATNAHVVTYAHDSVGSILAQTSDGQVHQLSLLNADATYDFAVLKFDKAPGASVHPLVLSASQPRIGTAVYAIGNPLGRYPLTVSEGIISGRNRNFTDLVGRWGYLQTTATTFNGVSGGPLLNGDGEVVGMMSKVASSEHNTWISHLNFALEAELLRTLALQIINTGALHRSWLGVQLGDSAVNGNGRPFGPVQKPPRLLEVFPDSPAYALLSPWVGGQLLQVNGVSLHGLEDAFKELEKTRPGAAIKLTLEKEGKTVTVQCTPDTLSRSHLTYLTQRFILDQPLLKARPQERQPFEVELNPATSGNARRRFVVAAGRYTSGPGLPFVHEVHFSEDLGGAIKQYSLTGRIDLLLHPSQGRFAMDSLDVMGFNLDGSPPDQIGKPILFY